MPPNTVKVDRTTKWGNPFTVTTKMKPGSPIRCAYGLYFAVPSVEDSVACYREMVSMPEWADRLAIAKIELRGKDLACWCKTGTPCHADVLLEIANG
jgi:hypothetical protein